MDVEDKQSGAWHSLTPYDGGLSGWRLLWDRICPIPSLRFGGAVPRYRELVNALSWIAHSQNLRRMCQDYRVDLYLRPPNIGAYKLMDFHLIDRIVRASYLCASSSGTTSPVAAIKVALQRTALASLVTELRFRVRRAQVRLGLAVGMGAARLAAARRREARRQPAHQQHR